VALSPISQILHFLNARRTLPIARGPFMSRLEFQSVFQIPTLLNAAFTFPPLGAMARLSVLLEIQQMMQNAVSAPSFRTAEEQSLIWTFGQVLQFRIAILWKMSVAKIFYINEAAKQQHWSTAISDKILPLRKRMSSLVMER
jgi:hypothetical protein